MNETKPTARRNRKPVTAAIETATIVAPKENTMTKIETPTAAVAVIAPAAKKTRRNAYVDPGASAALRTLFTANPHLSYVQDNRKPGKEPGTTVGAVKFLSVQGGKVVNVTRLIARAAGIAPNSNGAIVTPNYAEGMVSELAETLGLELTVEESF
jgi:hypothetical protein